MEAGTYQYRPEGVDISQVFKKILLETKRFADSKNLSVLMMLNKKQMMENERFFVKGEPLLCYSMLANLFKNALEASPNGASITIYLEKETGKINIHNQGAVPKKIRDKFFDKYTTAGKSNGSGLGTYSAKLMAQTQNGSIHFKTSEGTGTTVTVQLQVLELA